MAPVKASEYHCGYIASSREEMLRKGNYIHSKYGRYLEKDRLVVDLGCGEGAALVYLQHAGFQKVLGVESNEELYRLGRSNGAPVVHGDIVDFLGQPAKETATYLYLDVMEHVPYEYNMEVLRLIHSGSRLIIQTPNTRSILGHAMYMNVPSHVAPYAPPVISEMLHRSAYRLIAEGTVDGSHEPSVATRIRARLIRTCLGIDPAVLLDGGNYYAVADRVNDRG